MWKARKYMGVGRALAGSSKTWLGKVKCKLHCPTLNIKCIFRFARYASYLGFTLHSGPLMHLSYSSAETYCWHSKHEATNSIFVVLSKHSIIHRITCMTIPFVFQSFIASVKEFCTLTWCLSHSSLLMLPRNAIMAS